ncbi:MAG TPA: hypothetical protein VMW07_02035 [Gallionella sp.]|nr:hypothetical protein [Gallionella sp.]
MVVNRKTLRIARFGLGTLYLFMLTPVARTWFEATMTAHMLLQIPLLAAIGFAASRLLPERCQLGLLAAVGGAVPCVVLAIFASSYWMLPRALDAALANPLAETGKFLSIPILIGIPLALAWRRLSILGRGFVWTNFFSMLAVLGWLYIAAPVRICNSYLVNEQVLTGWHMVKLALFLFVWWLARFFIGSQPVPR